MKNYRPWWILTLLGWAVWALAFWLGYRGLGIEWTMPVLIGLTVGLSSNWLWKKLGWGD